MKKLMHLYLFSIAFNIQAQHFDLKYQNYLGFKDRTYYFFQYGKRYENVKPSLIEYYLNEKNEFIVKNSTEWLNIRESGFFVFKNSILEIYYNRTRSELKFKLNDTTLVYKTNPSHDFSHLTAVFFPSDNALFIAAHSHAPIYIFDLRSLKLSPLPLVGGNIRVKGNYIFYESLHYSDSYSDFPEDIYRVHKNDLKNPVKILIQVEENWYPYSPDVIYARTFPKVGKCATKKCQGAFYNIKDKRYIPVKDYIHTDKFFELNSKDFILDIVREDNREFFVLKEVPKAPTEFPYVIENDESQVPRGNLFKYYNIPLKEKTLPGTFVTYELLYDAPESVLKKLTKEQLRILRNTFFAFQGYKFSSSNLTAFFNQFDWYRKMSAGDKSNDDIVIWPDEKERVDIIKRIEGEKK